MSGEHEKGGRLSLLTVNRLSLYLRRLEALEAEGIETVSSAQLAQHLGITDAQVRKDLAALGHLGYPGVGYYPRELIEVLRDTLGLQGEWPVVLIGAGNLARALLKYRGFGQRGFHIVCVFDADPAKIGEKIDQWTVLAMDRLAEQVAAYRAQLAIVAVPASAAQAVADALVACGIKGILNFAPTVLRVPAGVHVVAVDLAMQLEQLAYLVRTQTGTDSPPD
ncbi:MAG: redox-sensing transcriptional repressor Rex [Gemmatales bacterium]|nr:redox-sensing transcriptional repressor Rex [Gemmatales bacterium]MDW8385421.1 redox-sensing transcriptional repressor Rex [Gemmatales bacterium]